MIEVVFSDSACGSLKVAQHYSEGEYQSGISVFFGYVDGRQPTEKEIEDARQQAEKEERLAWDCASCWRTLQNENAPLRVVLNGRLISMLENLYDPVIIREIESESGEFQEVMIVGRVLGKYQLGIGDSWIALRIEEMIHAGRLETVTETAENMPLYHRVLKRKSGR